MRWRSRNAVAERRPPASLRGKQVFATRVNLPTVTMPEESYLGSSLAEMAEQIREGLSEAVGEAFE